MFKNLKIRTRLLISFLILSIVPFAVLGVVTLMTFVKSLSGVTYSQLENTREVKKYQIQSFFSEKQKNMKMLMETVSSLQKAAFEKLETIQEIKRAEIEGYFKHILRDVDSIAHNSSVYRAMLDFKTLYDMPGNIDQGMYNYLENIKYAGSLSRFKKDYGYYDLLLVSAEGLIVFSTNREADLGKFISAPPLKNTGISQVFTKALKKASIQDFSIYKPSQNRYMAFAGAPVLDQFGNAVGVIILKFDNDYLNALVQRGHAKGSTENSFLLAVHNDKMIYRSNPENSSDRFGQVFIGKEIFEENNTGKQRIVTILSEKPQIMEYDRIKVGGLNWLLVTVIDLESVIAPKLKNVKEDYFQKFISIYGYFDLLLITPAGDVFYSVAKSPEYRTNLVTGSHAGTSLGKLFHRVSQTGQFAFEDFQPYASRSYKPVAFIAQPVMYGENVELVVVLQLSLETINQVMQERSGMGNTGETYLVGSDMLMRSDSYLDPGGYSVQATFLEPLRKQINTRATQNALAGYSGRELTFNYNRDEVLSAYSPVRVWDETWALVAEIDSREAFYPVRLTIYFFGVIGILGILVISGSSVLIARRISNPIKELKEASEDISKGKMDISLSPEMMSARDEVGQLAKAFNDMAIRLRSIMGDLQLEISERRRTEQELSQLQTLLTNIINSMPSILVGVDISGTIMQWNQQAECETGMVAADAEGKKLEEAYPLLANQMEQIKKAIEQRTVRKDERILVESNGNSTFLDMTIYPLAADGAKGAVIRLDDVTERVRMEEIMVQTEKMMSVGGLAAGMAHEINNPLGIILQGVQNTFRRLSPELRKNKEKADQLGIDLEKVQQYLEDRNINKYLEAMQDAGIRAARIIENMLDFSSNSRATPKNRQNVNNILEDTLLLAMKDFKVDSRFDFRKIKIFKDYEEDLPDILCSKTEIEQVFLNILKNAAQAMHELEQENIEPTITIKTRFNNGLVEIYIEDNGPGMDEKTKKRIFEPFFTTKPTGIGTGLGLSVSYFIITKNHFGKIDVRSVKGKSTLFVISLPVVNEAGGNGSKNEAITAE